MVPCTGPTRCLLSAFPDPAVGIVLVDMESLLFRTACVRLLFVCSWRGAARAQETEIVLSRASFDRAQIREAGSPCLDLISPLLIGLCHAGPGPPGTIHSHGEPLLYNPAKVMAPDFRHAGTFQVWNRCQSTAMLSCRSSVCRPRRMKPWRVIL